MAASDDTKLNATMTAWTTTIGVQKHFNDIELKIRNYAITVLVALLGAAAVALREGSRVEFSGVETSLATLLVGAALIAWLMFYFMDRIWYHQLLVGAVKHGQALEEVLRPDVPGIGLTGQIGESSPYKLLWLFKLHTRHKMAVFYGVVGAVLVALAVIAHNSAGAEETALGSAIAATPDGSTVCGRLAGAEDEWLVVDGTTAFPVDELGDVVRVEACS